MLKSYDGFALNACGEFFRQAMQRPPAAPLASGR
jgi:hypothetical protein